MNTKSDVYIVIIFILVICIAMVFNNYWHRRQIEKQNIKIETLQSIINDFKMENLKSLK